MPENVVRKVGRRIRELRQKKGWSQENLFEMADFSLDTRATSLTMLRDFR